MRWPGYKNLTGAAVIAERAESNTIGVENEVLNVDGVGIYHMDFGGMSDEDYALMVV